MNGISLVDSHERLCGGTTSLINLRWGIGREMHIFGMSAHLISNYAYLGTNFRSTFHSEIGGQFEIVDTIQEDSFNNFVSWSPHGFRTSFYIADRPAPIARF